MRAKAQWLGGGLLVMAVLAVTAWLVLPAPRPAPEVSFTTLEGKTLELASLRGHPVLVTFWATSCPHCIKDMVALTEMHRELGPRGLRIIGVAMPYDPPNRVLAMVEARRTPYTIALDVQGRVLRAFEKVPGTPTTFLVGPDGTIVERTIGQLDARRMKARIMGLL